MKKILAAILAIGSIFTGMPDAVPASDIPEAPEEVAEAEVPEFSVIPGDGTYAVAPLADVSDFTFSSLSEVTFINKILSQFQDEYGNYNIPCRFSTLKISIDEFASLIRDTDSYYFFGRFYSGPYPLSFNLYCIPKSEVTFSNFTVSSCSVKSSSHTHFGISKVSGTYYCFVFNWTSSNVEFFSSNLLQYSDSSVYLYTSCISTSNQSLYFYDDSLFSLIPSNQVSTISKLKFISDISSIKLVDYNTKEVHDIFPSKLSKPSTRILTVNYFYSENNPAADPVTRALAPGEEYNIPSPEIEGYTPTIPLVTGTMPDEDLTIDVYYTKAFYHLTIKYQYQDGSQAAEDVTLQYPMGFTYDVSSPEIPGYTPDKPTVSGTMPGKPLEVVVTYSPTLYTLSIFYQYKDGTQAAASHREQLAAGAAYSVLSPKITGYKPNIEEISGFMTAKDINFTVIYEPDSGGGSTGGGSGEGEGEGDGDGDDDKGGGDSGGGSSGGEWSGNDPFFPGQPDFSGYDPFDMSDILPDWNNCPFHVRELPPYTYDPFVIPGG